MILYLRAIQSNNEFAVESLIRAGSDVDVPNFDGKPKPGSRKDLIY